MNKRGLELTVNFIVMLILALVVFGFGIKFAYDIFGKSTELYAAITSDMERQLENSLNSNLRVALTWNMKDITPGNTAVYGLGILNLNSSREQFFLEIRQGTATALNEVDIISFSPGITWTKNQGFAIKANENRKLPIAVIVPYGTPKGVYSLVVIVHNCQNACDETGPVYFQKQTIYARVI